MPLPVTPPVTVTVTVFAGHIGAVSAVAFSSTGRTLASVASDGLRLWSLADGTSELALDHTVKPSCVASMPDGAEFVIGTSLGAVYYPRNGKVIRTEAEDETTAITQVAVSPDGTMFATGSQDGRVRLWLLGDQSGSSISTGR